MRQNKPALIDPRNTIQAATDRQLGINTPVDILDEIAALKRQVASQSQDIARLLRQTANAFDDDGIQVIGANVVLAQFTNLVAIEESPNPSLAIGSAAGSGGSPSVSFPRGGSDVAGQIRVVCGTSSLTTGTLVTLAFNRTKATSNYIVLITANSAAARAANLRVSTLSTTGFPILADTAPSSGAQIDINYLVVETPAS